MFLHGTTEANLCRLSLILAKRVSRHNHLRFLSLEIMSTGQNGKVETTPSGSNASARLLSDSHVDGNGLSGNEFYSSRGKNGRNRSRMSKWKVHQSASPSFSNEDFPPLDVNLVSSSKGGHIDKMKTRIDLGPGQKTDIIVSTQLEDSPLSNYVSQHDDSSPSAPLFNKEMKHAHANASPYKRNYFKHELDAKKWDSSHHLHNVEPFDICLSRRRNFRMEKENECRQTVDWTREGILRPGMVLLKHYLTIREQILIVRICQELGKGPGGFYQPGYNDGAKLRLRMMCLGLDWDPQTRKYGKKRQVDGCEPSVIPSEFKQLVQRSMSEAHALIKMDSKVSNVEDILPALSPDICIVNFYNTSGRLGLHQDRDESRYSLKKGLPVVSFSVGDSAEFLYGDERDANKAEKVLLESGDVLIFGGESRHVFHGVSSINPNSAPGALLENTMLRPGRLNLTFRQY